MDLTLSDLSVVIRSSGERTLDLLKSILQPQISPKYLAVVNERPFEKALRYSYEAAVDMSAEWTVILDADTLLFDDSLEILRMRIQNSDKSTFMLQGKVYDRIIGIYKGAGHRIYKTNYLKNAIDLIPFEKEALRPETETLNRMSKKGFKSKFIRDFLGLHDYEQYYRDLYRTAFVHAKKHPEFIQQIVENSKNSTNEIAIKENKLIIRGLIDGLTHKEALHLDSEWFKQFSSQALKELDISERLEISVEQFKYIKEKIQKDKNLILHEREIVGDRKIERYFYNIKNKGPIKGSLYSIARFLDGISR